MVAETNNPEAMAKRIMMCAQAGNQKELDHLLRTEVSPDLLKTVVSHLRSAGNAAYKSGSYVEAYNYYNEAMSGCHMPEDQEILALLYSNMSAAKLAAGELEEAARLAGKAIETRPEWAKGWFRAAKALQEQKRLSEALKMVAIARQKDSECKALRKYEEDLTQQAAKAKLLQRVDLDYSRFQLAAEEDDEEDEAATRTSETDTAGTAVAKRSPAAIEFSDDLTSQEREQVHALLTGQPVASSRPSADKGRQAVCHWDPQVAWDLHASENNDKRVGAVRDLDSTALHALLHVAQSVARLSSVSQLTARCLSTEGRKFSLWQMEQISAPTDTRKVLQLGMDIGCIAVTVLTKEGPPADFTLCSNTAVPHSAWLLRRSLEINGVGFERLQEEGRVSVAPLEAALATESCNSPDEVKRLCCVGLEYLLPTGPSEILQRKLHVNLCPARMTVAVQLAAVDICDQDHYTEFSVNVSLDVHNWSPGMRLLATRQPQGAYQPLSGATLLHSGALGHSDWAAEGQITLRANASGRANALVVTSWAGTDIPGCGLQWLDGAIDVQLGQEFSVAWRRRGSSLAVRLSGDSLNPKVPRSSRMPGWLTHLLAAEPRVVSTWSREAARLVRERLEAKTKRLDKFVGKEPKSVRHCQALVQEATGGVMAAAVLSQVKSLYESRGARPTPSFNIRCHESSPAAAAFSKNLLAQNAACLIELDQQQSSSGVQWHSLSGGHSRNAPPAVAESSQAATETQKLKLKQRVTVLCKYPQETRPPKELEQGAALLALATFLRAPRGPSGQPQLPPAVDRMPKAVDILISQQVDVCLVGDGIVPTLRAFTQALTERTPDVLPARARVLGVPVVVAALIGRVRVDSWCRFLGGVSTAVEMQQGGKTDGYFAIDPAVVPLQCVAPPQVLLDFDFSSAEKIPMMQNSEAVEFKISDDCTPDGILMWCDILLREGLDGQPGVGITGRPRQAEPLLTAKERGPWSNVEMTPYNHPQCALQLLPPLIFRAGEVCSVDVLATDTNVRVEWHAEKIANFRLRQSTAADLTTRDAELGNWAALLRSQDSVLQNFATVQQDPTACKQARTIFSLLSSCPAAFTVDGGGSVDAETAMHFAESFFCAN